jgi:hypothetical protein
MLQSVHGSVRNKVLFLSGNVINAAASVLAASRFPAMFAATATPTTAAG